MNMAHDDFVAWFKAGGGWIDGIAVRLTDIEGMGMGVIALKDIDVSRSGVLTHFKPSDQA